MKKLFATVLLCFSTVSMAAVIASMPNQAGGKIVLTDEDCRHKGKNYPNLFKAYFYTPEGITGDGCWMVEEEVVTVVWLDNGATRRYPLNNFELPARRGRNL